MKKIKSVVALSCSVKDKNTGEEIFISAKSEIALKSAAFNVSGTRLVDMSEVILTKIPEKNEKK